jgi:hypothetical protein
MIGTRCQVRTCLHLAADGIEGNATNLQSRNAFSADPWRKTKAGATKEIGAYRAGRSEGGRSTGPGGA